MVGSITVDVIRRYSRCQAPSISVQKGVRDLLPERPEGCFAQKVPDTFLNPDYSATAISYATLTDGTIVQVRLYRGPKR